MGTKITVWSVMESYQDDSFEDGPSGWDPLYKSIDEAIKAVKDEITSMIEENDENLSLDDAIDVDIADDRTSASIYFRYVEMMFFINKHTLEI